MRSGPRQQHKQSLLELQVLQVGELAEVLAEVEVLEVEILEVGMLEVEMLEVETLVVAFVVQVLQVFEVSRDLATALESCERSQMLQNGLKAEIQFQQKNKYIM